MQDLFSKENLVIVRWKDAVNYSHRVQITDANTIGLVVNTNVGWIFDRNDERILLVHGYSESGEVDYFAIPVSCVVSIDPVIKESRRSSRKA